MLATPCSAELTGQAMSAHHVPPAKVTKERRRANVCRVPRPYQFVAVVHRPAGLQLGSAEAAHIGTPVPLPRLPTDTIVAMGCRRSAQPLHAMERSSYNP